MLLIWYLLNIYYLRYLLNVSFVQTFVIVFFLSYDGAIGVRYLSIWFIESGVLFSFSKRKPTINYKVWSNLGRTIS